MTIPGMRALVLVAALAPPTTGPGIDADVAVAWHDEARASAHLRQRVRSEVADELGIAVDAVQGDPTEIARRIVAREVPRGLVKRARDLGGRLDRIETDFRAGELAGAGQTLAQLRAELEAAPELPGVAGLAWREAVLAARIEWAAGEKDATDAALGRALALDPAANLSARDVPPALAGRFESLRRTIEAERASWPTASVEGEDDVELVVDGVPGVRPVPPGRHFLVAHRPGRAPVAAHRDVSSPWAVPDSELVLTASIPVGREPAERVCAALGLKTLVLAHVRERRVGLQAYRCGRGYGPRWVGSEATLPEGVREVLGAAKSFDQERARLDDAWPSIVQPNVGDPVNDSPKKKPWYKRAWVWVLVGGVVAGGVTTGAVLGAGARSSGVGVDSDDFLRP